MKKTLAMLLVLVLMLSLVSVAAFADKAVTLNVVTSYGGDDGNRKNFENVSKSIIPMFSSRSFIIFGLMFIYLIHFEFTFVWGVKRIF